MQKQNNTTEMHCPHCGTMFLAGDDLTAGLCFNCGRRLDIRTMRRDQKVQSWGWSSYEELLAQAQRQLNAKDFAHARTDYEKAVEAAPDDYEACWGLLMSGTKLLSEVSGRLPTTEYQAARACATPEQARALDKVWEQYEKQYRAYWAAKEKAAQERREQKRRNEEEAQRRERERQERERVRASEQARTAQNGWRRGSAAAAGTDDKNGERRMHPVLRYLLIGAGAVVAMLALAACATIGSGGGLFFFLVSFGLLGSGNRNRRDR